MLGSGQQLFDGGGVPTRAAPRRAFAHTLKLGGYLLEGAIERRHFDPGDQSNQAVVAVLRPCAVQQAGLNDPIVCQSLHSAAQPLDGPCGGLPAV